MSTAVLSGSMSVGDDVLLAPPGWSFVTNDPEAQKHPDRMFSMLSEDRKVVVIGDTRNRSFHVRDLSTGSTLSGQHLPSDTSAPWRIGRDAFRDIGEIGRAIIGVLSAQEAGS